MKLSVIIVNYNVMHFIDQCLHSVFRAAKGIDSEVFVVDNNSVDGSVKMIKDKFPEVQLIENKDNKGFSKANNQAIHLSKGEYVLLLNPDTVVEENTFRQVIEFMDQHSEAGGLGVKMLDGKGRFLPESKRGLPTPSVAFYKIFGLAAIFPKSRTFGKYHLGYLDRDEIHEVEILSGAFMLLRKKALEITGLLDEDFFMYGEDIDLSYRITRAGYKNYYFPKTRIIHYKGESTKKSSINYVFVFYQAMIIFARKHFSDKRAKTFSFLIHLAIYIRAFAALLKRFVLKIFLPLADFLLIFSGMFLIKTYWEQNVVFPEGGAYPPALILIAVPLYILTWLFSVYLSGGYDKPIKIAKIINGLIAGTVVILIIYALLGESQRFSRALIILGAVWSMISMTGFRYILHLLKVKQYRLGNIKNKRFIIVGEASEAERIEHIIRQTVPDIGFLEKVNPKNTPVEDKNFIGNAAQLEEIIGIFKIDEVVFCLKSLSSEQIINYMSDLQHTEVEYKMAPPESLSIIGSNSINSIGDFYTLQVNSIVKQANKRKKRIFDFGISLLFLSLFPVLIFIIRNPFNFFINIFRVLFANKSWVGYYHLKTDDVYKLPRIKPGIVNPSDAINQKNLNPELADNLNILYAKDYSLRNDFNIIIKALRNLGR